MTIRQTFREAWASLTRRDRWKLHLGLCAGCVLAAGLALRPQGPTPMVSPPDEQSAPLLRQELERRDARAMFGEVQGVARDTDAVVVVFVAPATERPIVHPDFEVLADPLPKRQGLGLLVTNSGDILSHVTVTNGRFDVEARLSDGRTVMTRVVALERESGLVLLRSNAADMPARASLDGTRAADGTILAAVSRGVGIGAPHGQPVYVTGEATDRLALAAFHDGLVPGTPLFALSGDAVAVVGADPQTAWSAPRALARLQALRDGGGGIPSTLGLRLQFVDARLQLVVGRAAVLVTDRDESGPAAQAGVQVGDGILRIDGGEVTGMADAVTAITALPTDAPREVVLVRAGKEVPVLVTARPTLADPIAGAPHTQVRAAGIPADRLLPLESREASGLSAGADVLTIDQRAMSERAAVAYLRRARRPSLLYVEHGGERFFAVVEPRP